MRKYTITIIAAFLLIIIAAIWNITCESDKRNIERQGQFQKYLVINSKPYKQSLKQDTLFAQRLDSIKLLGSSFREGTVSNEAEIKDSLK